MTGTRTIRREQFRWSAERLNPRSRELASLCMKRNVGTVDRIVRALAGLALLGCSAIAPLPWILRAGAIGVPGCYLLLTAIAGSCAGYALLGKSTCEGPR